MSEEVVETKQTETQNNNPNGATGPKGINWIGAKEYYMTSFSRSYADVARKFDVSLNTVEIRGSRENWVKARQDMGEKALLEFENNKILEIANANRNHIAVFRSIQAQATKKLFNAGGLKPSELKALAYSIKIGIDGERLVLGLPTSVSKSEIMGRLTTDLNLPPEQLEKIDKFFHDESK